MDERKAALNSEAIVLAHIIQCGSLSDEALYLNAESFFDPAHQIIFDVCVALDLKSESISLQTLEHELSRQNKIFRIGGASKLSELATIDISNEGIRDHIKRIHDLYWRRTLSQQLKTWRKHIFRSHHEADEQRKTMIHALREMDSSLESNRHGQSICDLLLPAFTEIERRYDRYDEPLFLQHFLFYSNEHGYLPSSVFPGDLTIIAGRPQSGKTAFLIDILVKLDLDDYEILCFSLDLDASILCERTLANKSRVSLQKISRGELNKHDWMNLTRAASALSLDPIWFDHELDGDLPTLEERITAFVVERKREHATMGSSDDRDEDHVEKTERDNKEEPRLIVMIDALHYIKRADCQSKQHGDCHNDLSQIVKSLKKLALELNVLILATIDLPDDEWNRHIEDDAPQFHELNRYGAIAQSADHIYFIYQSMLADPKARKRAIDIEIALAKSKRSSLYRMPLMLHREVLTLDMLGEQENEYLGEIDDDMEQNYDE